VLVHRVRLLVFFFFFLYTFTVTIHFLFLSCDSLTPLVSSPVIFLSSPWIFRGINAELSGIRNASPMQSGFLNIRPIFFPPEINKEITVKRETHPPFVDVVRVAFHGASRSLFIMRGNHLKDLLCEIVILSTWLHPDAICICFIYLYLYRMITPWRVLGFNWFCQLGA